MSRQCTMFRSLAHYSLLAGVISARGMQSSAPLCAEFIEKVKSTNPYYGKYADKIERRVRLDSTDNMTERLQQYLNEQRVDNISELSNSAHFSSPSFSQASSSAETSSGLKPCANRGLDSILRLDKLAALSTEEVCQLWRERFSTKDGLAAFMSAEKFREMHTRWQQYRTFLLPLPRPKGYEFFVVQFTDKHAHFTPLISFQAHGENAAECLKLSHYDELAHCRQIVLVRGEFDTQLLTAAEARCLVQQLQLFYSCPSQLRLQLLEEFSCKPESFQYQRLVDSLQELSA